jgi:hypothetical protein
LRKTGKGSLARQPKLDARKNTPNDRKKGRDFHAEFGRGAEPAEKIMMSELPLTFVWMAQIAARNAPHREISRNFLCELRDSAGSA